MAAPKQVPTPTKHPGRYPPHQPNPITQHGEHTQHPTNGQCHTRQWQKCHCRCCHRHPNDVSNDTSSVLTVHGTPTPAPIGAQGSTLMLPPMRQPTHPVPMPQHPNHVKCDHLHNQQYCQLCLNASGHSCPTSHPSIIYRCPCGITVCFSIPLAFEGGRVSGTLEFNLGGEYREDQRPRQPP
jgi:hypothetical protein